MGLAAEPEWVQQAAGRFDRELRRELAELYRPPGRLPALLQGPAGAVRRRWARVPVIVQVAPDCSDRDRHALSQLLVRSGCRQVRHHGLVRGLSARANLRSLQQLAVDPRVRRVWLDRPVRALLDVAAPTLRAPEVWQLGFTGKGVTVAVVDTGIHPHPDFTLPRNRIVGFFDVVSGRQEPYDDNGHGTHVAGIVAGNGFSSGGRFRGIAPEASLVGVKVLDRTGSGRLSDVIAGVEWCVTNRQRLGMRIINLSLGAPTVGSWRDDPLAMAVGAAWEAGLVVCCAAGNGGPDPSTIVTPGIHPAVITVGAADDRDTPDASDDGVAPFSSRGPTADGDVKPDVVLPGVNITSAVPPGSWLFRRDGRRASYATLSGTSMASPMGAGLAALILEKDPSATPPQVKARLMAAGRDLGEPPNVQGKGEPDGYRAVVAAVQMAI